MREQSDGAGMDAGVSKAAGVAVQHDGAGASRGALRRPEVLHLVRPAGLFPAMGGLGAVAGGSDAGITACLEVMESARDFRHRVMLVGPGETVLRAESLGLLADARISPPLNLPALGARGLKAWFRVHGQPQIIQCWGGEFAALKRRMGAVRSAWAIADFHSGSLATADSRGVLQTRPLLGSVGQQKPRSVADIGAMRATLGVQPGEVVLGLIADCPGELDAAAFAYVLGVLWVAGVRVTGVVPRGAAGLDRALRHVQGGGYIRRLCVADRPCAAWSQACDLGVWISMKGLDFRREEPTLGARMTIENVCASGLPVVMPDGDWARRVMPGGLSAGISQSGDPAAVAATAFTMLNGDTLAAGRAALVARARGGGLGAEVQGAWHDVAGARSFT